MSITIQGVTKSFGSFAAVDGIDLEIGSGELVALLGPSGSGKTTLLRIIAGLEGADEGSVRFHGEDATRTSARDRRVGFVFQHYALFRHMSVFENVAFGMKVRPRRFRPSKADIRAKVLELLKLVQLEGLANRYPDQLSGGQRQRVALARALAVEPKVLLLDEPFGALDAKVRLELRRWLRRLHDDLHITSIFVTHDQEEALEVADRVVVMNQGKIEQVGTPEEIYEHPATPFVYNFIGQVNLFHGRVHEGQVDLAGLELDAPEHAETRNATAVGYVRPHDLEVVRSAEAEPSTSAVNAEVRHIHPVGPVVRLELLRADTGGVIEAHVTRDRYRELGLRVGEEVSVSPKKLRIFVEPDEAVAGKTG